LRQTCEECKAAIKTAVEQQKLAEDEAKRLERDMKEFKNNKEGKITELKASVSALYLFGFHLLT
jgi:structural maintenance of chromosome 2